MQDNEARCKEITPYIHSFWTDTHVKSESLCVDERVAIPHSRSCNRFAPHDTSGSWEKICLSQYAWWLYMHREKLAKAIECVACTEIVKYL